MTKTLLHNPSHKQFIYDIGRVLGSYRLIGVLGEGGVGVVYLAEHIRLGRKVALKKLKEKFAAKPDTIEMFFNEARTVNQIGHPNIVEITDFVAEEGLAYCIMELLDGKTLQEVLDTEGPLPLRRALHIAHQTADALSAAHEKGVVHADIKPSNIFLIDNQGRADFVKLLDFGLSHAAQESHYLRSPKKSKTTESYPVVSTEKLKNNGDGLSTPMPTTKSASSASSPSGTAAVGTPMYMAPEQTEHRGDPRSDIYSLGVVCYHMFAGHPPFQAKTHLELIYKHLNSAPQRLSKIRGFRNIKVPRACSRFVMSCLEKHPDDRIQSAVQLRQEIEQAATNTRMKLETGSQPATIKTTSHLKRWASIALFCVAGLIGIGLAAWYILQPALVGVSNRSPDEFKVVAATGFPIETNPLKTTKTVNILIVTNVIGAEVTRLKPATTILGLTPLKLRIKPSDERWAVLVRRQGFKEKVTEFTINEDQTIAVDLFPEEAEQKDEAETEVIDDDSSLNGVGETSSKDKNRGEKSKHRRKHTSRKQNREKSTRTVKPSSGAKSRGENSKKRINKHDTLDPFR